MRRRCAYTFHRRDTPLHYAAERGHADVAAALLTHGADVNARNNDGCGGRSLFGATVGVRRAAVADRAGTNSVQIGMRTHTRSHAHAHANTGEHWTK